MISQRYGGLKIVFHPEKLKSLKEEIIASPMYVRFKPTNRCNHHCSFCACDPETGDTSVRSLLNRTAEIPREKMLEILRDFKEMGVKAVTYSGGGEPLIHPYIEKAMKKTLEYGIGLSIITNGQELNGEKAEILSKANWVRVSTNSNDSKTFSKIRRRPESWFSELEENIRRFAKMKRPGCEFGINYVVQTENAFQVYDSVKYFMDLGVNHVKITPMWNQDFKKYHEPIKESVLGQIAKAKIDFHKESVFEVHDTYAGDFSGASVPERHYQRCYIMQTVPVIGADCNVYFCHDKAYSTTGILGSIRDKSFRELWFSPEAAEIFRKFNPQESCRHHCTNDAKNLHIKGVINREPGYEILSDALDCYGEDVNFV
jgi:MoaA/NifB/PqqE/SkfB family radical SAM enzyme